MIQIGCVPQLEAADQGDAVGSQRNDHDALMR